MAQEEEDFYPRAVQESEDVRALIPRFLDDKAFIRTTEPIIPSIRREIGPLSSVVASNRDLAVCALANKACNTHAAIRLLTDNGDGDDAMALGRVLLENAVLLEWLYFDAPRTCASRHTTTLASFATNAANDGRKDRRARTRST